MPSFPRDRNPVQPEAATFGPAASAKVRVQSAKPNRILLFMRRGRAFPSEARSQRYLRCCWLELVRLLRRGHRGDFRSWLPSAFLRSRVAEKCWHRLGEQPGAVRTDLLAVARILVTTVDVWEKRMYMCLINIGTEQELIS